MKSRRRSKALAVWLTLACVLGAPGAVPGQGPDFSILLWRHLETLANLGPRFPGSLGHQQARQYIKSVGREAGGDVREHRFMSKEAGLPMFNIEIRIPGEEGGRPVLLGAHYDTRPFADEDPQAENREQPIVGANDGGSGVAVLLGLARYFREHPPRRPVHLVFFDGEDFGRKFSSDYFLGSKEYARRLAQKPADEWPFCVLVVDMVGDRDLQIYQEVYSKESAPWLVDLLFKTADQKGYPQFLPKTRYTIRDDHIPFLEMQIPSAVLIDFDYPFWHTLQDTLDKCSKESLLAVFSVVAEVVGKL
ncbi:MAG: M28 family peptidase [Nitrospinaceae bacterium]